MRLQSIERPQFSDCAEQVANTSTLCGERIVPDATQRRRPSSAGRTVTADAGRRAETCPSVHLFSMHPIDIIQSHYLVVLAFMAGMAVGVYVGLEAARSPEIPAEKAE